MSEKMRACIDLAKPVPYEDSQTDGDLTITCQVFDCPLRARCSNAVIVYGFDEKGSFRKKSPVVSLEGVGPEPDSFDAENAARVTFFPPET